MKHSINRALKVGRLLGCLSFIPIISLNTLAGSEPSTPEAAAFARYIAAVQHRDDFLDLGPVAIQIEASLPGLYKHAGLLAVRQAGDEDRSRYQVVAVEGDGIVAQEVIAPYYIAQERLELMPVSALAITPSNYKFRYRGTIGAGTNLTYMYQITPKKNREGLMEGQIWIDAATGAVVFQQGRFVGTPRTLASKIEVVSDTTLVNGNPVMRVTHVAIETPRLGKGELTITEASVSSLRQQHPIDQ